MARIGYSEEHECDIRLLERLAMGSHFWLRRAYRDLGGAHSGNLLGRHSKLLNAEIPIEINDSSSTVVTLRQLAQTDRAIADEIQSHAPCNDSTGFFIASDTENTVVIPTSEILRACYMPSGAYLADYLMPYDRSSSSTKYAHGTVAFNGYGYFDRPAKLFPVKIARYHERAQHEISQLLPRACAHSRLFSNEKPILIRPPFTGRVIIGGRALMARSPERGKITIFVSPVSFVPPCSLSPAERITRHFVLPFAPRVVGQEVFLSEIGASARSSLRKRNDAATFPRQMAALKGHLLNGADLLDRR